MADERAGHGSAESNLDSTMLFLKDLTGDEKKGIASFGFIDIIKKYAPSVSLVENTSKLNDIGRWKCDELLGSPDAVYGLNKDERKEICRVINHLREIVRAAEVRPPLTGAMSQNKHYAVSPHETLLDLFDAARKVSIEADTREQKK